MLLKLMAPIQVEGQVDLHLFLVEAEAILNRIEQLGMLPPITKKTDPGHFPGDAFEYQLNEWEPEDEEK